MCFFSQETGDAHDEIHEIHPSQPKSAPSRVGAEKLRIATSKGWGLLLQKRFEKWYAEAKPKLSVAQILGTKNELKK